MAESTAALKFDDLMAITAERAGYGYLADVAAGLSAAQETEVELYVAEGYREFLLSYHWSFTKPTGTSVLWATTTGRVSGQGVYNSPSTLIVAAGFYPTMIGQSLVFDDSGTGYTITAYKSSSQVYVSGDASSELSNDTFTVTADGSYRLPDDFGGLLGDVFYQADEGRWIPLGNTGVAELLHLLQMSTGTGRPTACAVDPQTLPTAGTEATGQRFNLIAWRIPASNYTVKYQYQVLPPTLIADGYPYGGTRHAETIKYACLAAMERGKLQLPAGPYQRQFDRLLGLSIKADQRGARAGSLGFLVNARPSRRRRGSYVPQAGTVTVGGVEYP